MLGNELERVDSIQTVEGSNNRPMKSQSGRDCTIRDFFQFVLCF